MKTSLEATEYVYSQFGSDPDMSELVEMFVAEIPHKIAKLEAHAAAADWRALETIAHQLKGAAGGYGFDRLTVPAWRVEQAVREQHSEKQILASVEALLELCQRVRTGAADHFDGS